MTDDQILGVRSNVSDLQNELRSLRSRVHDLELKFQYSSYDSSKLAEKIAEGDQRIRKLEYELEWPLSGKSNAVKKIISIDKRIDKHENRILFAPLLLLYAFIIMFCLNSCDAKRRIDEAKREIEIDWNLKQKLSPPLSSTR